MKTCIFSLLVLVSNLSWAQNSYHINWAVGASGGAASLTIQAGDTITWTLTDSFSHTVTSLPGAAESFNSGTMTGMGQTFSHVFTVIGTNNYHCNFHPPSMFGTITVETASVTEMDEESWVQIYPNPGVDRLYLNVRDELIGKEYTITDIQGKALIQGMFTGSESVISISELSKGIYFFHVSGTKGNYIRLVKD